MMWTWTLYELLVKGLGDVRQEVARFRDQGFD